MYSLEYLLFFYNYYNMCMCMYLYMSSLMQHPLTVVAKHISYHYSKRE